MKITDLRDHQILLQQISECAGLIHQYGWAEANAGNLSIEVSQFVADADPDSQYYIVSRTGSRYRQTAQNPLPNLLLIQTKDEDIYYPHDARPTIEWVSHRCLHRLIGANSVVLHTHPAEIIALSDLNFCSQELNLRFACLLPELPLYLPEGFAVAPYCRPGSEELCEASQRALNGQRALIWSGHGLLCFGKNLDEALDYMEIMVKAAKILLLLR